MKDLYQMAIDMARDCGGLPDIEVNPFDCGLFFQEDIVVSQTFNFLYSGTYSYFAKGNLPLCEFTTTQGIEEIEQQCTAMEVEDMAFMVKNYRHIKDGCAALQIGYDGELINWSGHCSCPLVIPEQGTDGDDWLKVNAFDKKILQVPFFGDMQVDEDGIIDIKYSTIRLESDPAPVDVEVVTALTVEYRGMVRPKIKKKWYEKLTQAVLKYGGEADSATGTCKNCAYSDAVIKRSWYDGYSIHGPWHRFSSGAMWYGGLTGPMFLCALGGGMDGQTFDCTGAHTQAGTGRWFPSFIDVKGGTCTPQLTDAAEPCIDGCINAVRLDSVKSGYNGDCGNARSDCALGDFKVHAAWYNQMSNIIEAFSAYKDCPCEKGECRFVGGEGVSAWWHGYYLQWNCYQHPISETDQLGVYSSLLLGGCAAGEKVAAASATQQWQPNVPQDDQLYPVEVNANGSVLTGKIYANFGPVDEAGNPIDLEMSYSDQHPMRYLCRGVFWSHVIGCNKTIKLSVTSSDGGDLHNGEVTATMKVFPPEAASGGLTVEGLTGEELLLGPVNGTDNDRCYILLDIRVHSFEEVAYLGQPPRVLDVELELVD